MPTLAELLALFEALAKFGASPAIQQALMAEMAVKMGVAQNVLEAAIAAAKDVPPPKS